MGTNPVALLRVNFWVCLNPMVGRSFFLREWVGRSSHLSYDNLENQLRVSARATVLSRRHRIGPRCTTPAQGRWESPYR